MEKSSRAPKMTPSPTSGTTKHQSENATDATGANPRNLFFLATLNMTWQLAIVVLAPVLGGHTLDNHLHSAPLWTLIGFVVAAMCAALIVWRQAKFISPNITNTHKHEGHRS